MSKKPGKGLKAAAVKKAAAASVAGPKGPERPGEEKKSAVLRALGKLKALQSAAEAKKDAEAEAAGRRIPLKEMLLIGGGVCALAVLFLLIFFSPAEKMAPAGPSSQTAALPKGTVLQRIVAAMPRLTGEDRKDYPVIRTIRFTPPQPTRVDTLKAEVLADAPEPERLTYAYVWKINDRIVEGAKDDTLDLSAREIKKRDLITVTVTPRDGRREGFAVESPVVAVHSIPPTLDLKVLHQTRRASESLRMQLVSSHPDSEGVTFSLAAPIVPGMSIDPKSGSITWMIQPDQQGVISFGAMVEDTEQTKVTRVFNISVQKSLRPPAPAETAPGQVADRRSPD